MEMIKWNRNVFGGIPRFRPGDRPVPPSELGPPPVEPPIVEPPAEPPTVEPPKLA